MCSSAASLGGLPGWNHASKRPANSHRKAAQETYAPVQQVNGPACLRQERSMALDALRQE